MIRRPFQALASALLAMVSAAAVAAPGPQGKPDGWQTWTWEGSCYAIVYAEPGAGTGSAGTDRAFIAVKHVPGEKTFDGVTVASGMNIPVGTEGLIEVNGKEYPLLVFKGAGFVRSGEPEKSLVENLGKAAEARVTWVLKDQMTVQTYKVPGFQAAHKVIDAACPRPPGSEASVPAPEEAKPAKPTRNGRGGRG
jgi:hypothetical protein